MKYCDLNGIVSPLPRSLTNIRSSNNESKELVYKCCACDPRFPGGNLTVAPSIDPPNVESLEWTVHVEPKEGPDDFVELVLEHVKQGAMIVLAEEKKRLLFNDLSRAFFHADALQPSRCHNTS